MDKRSWPWKKKSSEKGLLDSGGVSGSLDINDKIKHLNERLLAADDIVQQHVKVAEEAVTGWEKTKADYILVKQELETAMEQKQAAEDRISHLDGALKQCMQHLRQVREEQEEKVHEAIMKKTRDWERIRLELEERLADSDQQLAEAQHQNSLLYKKVREQTDGIAQISQARAKAEADVEKLKARLEAFDKENATLKYESIILKKELEIRNQEKEINKRAADLVSRQHLDDIKKINKLEAECQRLRNLVKKRLPGPQALVKMKMEVDGPEPERRRPGGKAYSSMDDDTRMTNRRSSRGSDKRSGYDGHFPKSPRILLNGNGIYSGDTASSISLSVSKEPSQASMSEDGNDDERSVADSWASALISELATLQKEKAPKENLDSIDDFIEMERLASLPPGKESREGTVNEQLTAKEIELQEAHKLCTEVQQKLSAAEEQLNLLRSENVTNELKLFTLQQNLLSVLEDSEKADPSKVLQDVKSAVLTSQCSSVDGVPATVMKMSNGNGAHVEKPLARTDSGDKSGHIGPEIPSVVCKVVRLVEDLASEIMTQHFTSPQQNGPESNGGDCNVYTSTKPRPVELENAIRRFITVSTQYLDSKADVAQFITELSSVLSQIKLDLRVIYSCLESKAKLRSEAVHVVEPEVMSDTGSPVSRASNSDVSEAIASKGSPEDDASTTNPKVLQLDEELRKVRAEKAALESHMRAEFSRMASIEQTLPQLKQEKADLETTLAQEKEQLEKVKSQLVDAEQMVTSLRVRLASAELSRSMAEENLSSTIATKMKLDALLEQSRLELAQVQSKLKSVEAIAEQERLRNEELQLKVEELQELLQKAKASSTEAGVAIEAGKSMKEQEITDAAEKLAECQRTILVLGQQLKGIASVQDGATAPEAYRRNGNINKVRQRMSSDPSELSNFDDINSDIAESGDEATTHENGSQTSGLATKPKTHSKVDLSKSLILDQTCSPRKHGKSLSRFFSRQKHA